MIQRAGMPLFLFSDYIDEIWSIAAEQKDAEDVLAAFPRQFAIGDWTLELGLSDSCHYQLTFLEPDGAKHA